MHAVASSTLSSMSPQRTSGLRRPLNACCRQYAFEADKGEPLSVLEKGGWQTFDESDEQSRCRSYLLADASRHGASIRANIVAHEAQAQQAMAEYEAAMLVAMAVRRRCRR
jgi:hypothetical protein